jgi:hypothetical protein
MHRERTQPIQITLLDLPRQTFARWKAGRVGRIGRDGKSRLSNLIGIHKALRIAEAQRAAVLRTLICEIFATLGKSFHPVTLQV